MEGFCQPERGFIQGKAIGRRLVVAGRGRFGGGVVGLVVRGPARVGGACGDHKGHTCLVVHRLVNASGARGFRRSLAGAAPGVARLVAAACDEGMASDEPRRTA